MNLSRNNFLISVVLCYYCLLYVFYTGGDLKVYRGVFHALETNFISSAQYYFLSLRPLDIVHFIYMYVGKLLLLNHLALTLILNFMLIFFINRRFCTLKIPFADRLFFFFLNHYILVLALPGERVKFSVIFLALFVHRSTISYSLLTVLSHLQGWMIFFLFQFHKFNLALRFVVACMFICIAWIIINQFSLMDVLKYKFLHYTNSTDFSDFILIGIFASGVFLRQRINAPAAIFLFVGIILLLIFGGDRINFILFFVYALAGFKSIFRVSIFRFVNIALCFKGSIFVFNILGTGNGY